MPMSPALQLLQNSLSCCTYNSAQHTDILIEETDVQAKLKKVKLRASTGDWFAFAPDKGRGRKALMSPLLACGKEHAHHRACDCVVVLCHENRLTVLYVDLKSGNPTGYAGQFKSTRQFMRYALELIKEFHENPLIIEREQYVILYGGSQPSSISKKPTVPERIAATQPDKAYKRAVPNDATLRLKELLG